MLKTTNVTRRFGAKTAVDGVSLEIPAGQMVGVIGRSGAGKSTLLRMINRLIDVSEGAIHFGGLEVSGLRGQALRDWQRDCAMIFQQFNLVPRLDVITNVMLGRLNRRNTLLSLLQIFSEEEQLMALKALERLDIAQTASQWAQTLSGGQQQRVAIARALMQEPKVILADEPIASLDPRNAKVVMDSLAAINEEQGITVITNLHTLDTARNYCERIIGMAAGRVVFDGTAGRAHHGGGARALRGRRARGSLLRSDDLDQPRGRRAQAEEEAAAGTRRRPDRADARCRRPQLISPFRACRLAACSRGPGRWRSPSRHQRETSMSAIRTVLMAGVALASFATPVLAQQDVIRIGLLGGENEADRLADNQCLIDKLPAALGVKQVQLFPAADYDGVIQGLLGGTLDIAGLGASGYAAVYLQDPNAVEPFLTNVQTDGSTGYYSIALARQDSGITKITEAKGKKLGYADPDSTSGYLIPLVTLPETLGMKPDEFFAETSFNGGHENNVLALLDGKIDVAVTWGSGVGEFSEGYTSGNIRSMVDKGMLDMEDVVEVWRSPLIPNGPMVDALRPAAGDEGQDHCLLHGAAERRLRVLPRHRERRLHRLHPGDGRVLPADHRRPQSHDRQLR